MISRTEIHPKARKFAERMLRPHPVHGRVFAPWGVYGATYLVSEEADYQKISDSYAPLLALVIVALTVFRVMQSFDWIFRMNLAGIVVAGTGLIAIVYALHARRTAKLTRSMTIAEPRPPYGVAFRQDAREQTLWRLWLYSALCSACGGGALLMMRYAHGSQRWALWFIIALLAALTAKCSLMIALREIPLTRKAGISPL